MEKTKIEQEFDKRYEQFKQKDTATQVLFAILFFFAVPIAFLIVFGAIGIVTDVLETVLVSVAIDAAICYFLYTGWWYGKWNGIPRKTIFLILSAAWLLSAIGNVWNFCAIIPFLILYFVWGRTMTLPTGSDKKE